MRIHLSNIAKNAMGGIAQARLNVMMAFLNLANEVMSKDASLSKLDRELVGAHLSRRFGCDYCEIGHLDTAEALGGAEARSRIDAPDARLHSLLSLGEAVMDNTVTDAHIKAVLASGFDEHAVQDVIFVAALFGYANRMVTGFGIEYREERDRKGSMALANGYLTPAMQKAMAAA